MGDHVAMRASISALLSVSLVACSSDSSDVSGAADASGADAADGGASPDGTTDAATDSAADAAPDPCGPLTTSWSRCARNPLVQAGYHQLDGRYELSIGDPDVTYDDAQHAWRAYWSTGLAPTYADPPQLGIKYAESPDGVAWTVQASPAILASTTPGDWDEGKLETPTVVQVASNPPDSRFLLFYSGAPTAMKTVNGSPVPWYQIGLATSADGKSFTRLPAGQSPYGKAGLVLMGKDVFPGVMNVADGLVADPEIVLVGSTLHLFFSSLAVDAKGAPLAFGVSHATSSDGIHWTAVGSNPIAASNFGKGPSVVKDADGTYEMFYQNDSPADLMTVPTTFNPQLGIWRVTSPDLVTWSGPGPMRELTWDGAFDSEKYGWIAVGDMTLVGGEYRYYFPAFSTTAPPSPDWVAPTHSGFQTSLIVLDLARRK